MQIVSPFTIETFGEFFCHDFPTSSFTFWTTSGLWSFAFSMPNASTIAIFPPLKPDLIKARAKSGI